MIDESTMLREEIMLSMKTVKGYNNILYTTTVALLAFAFNSANSALFLLPFIVLIPLFLLTKREMMQVMRIGAYILVFLEESSIINWEKRLNSYDILFKKNSHKHIPLNAYLGLSLLCLTLSISNTDYLNFYYYGMCMTIIQLILFLFSITVFGFLSPNYVKMKKEYIKQWELVKIKEETKKARLSILNS